MAKLQKVKVRKALVVPIVGDAALAGPVADGKLIPVLILDASSRKDLSELIRLHTHLPPGDVNFQWARGLDDDDQVMLHLRFIRPMDVEVVLVVSIEHQGILVESMLDAGAVYLQTGVAGDRLITTMDAPRILVELPDTGFRPYWEQLAMERMTVVMSQSLGISRREGREAAQRLLRDARRLTRLRMRQ